MIFNDKIKFVIIDNKVITLNLETETFCLLDGYDDFMFFSNIKNCKNLQDILDKIKNSGYNVNELVEVYQKSGFLKGE